ncbi:polysaccharide pyruvyl transferase family protein [Lactobacillus sp. MYD3]|nr:polysaccharide pyruvyl transferase family protein [Lacticaseibacillus paracasei]NVO35440.1 polysaccharide pyruvyl transferase family protein [Lacticaseibacillus paracasei subsp. paracasei]
MKKIMLAKEELQVIWKALCSKLLNKPVIYFFGLATYGNIGDIAISIASEAFILQNSKRVLITINDSVSVRLAKVLRHFVTENDCVVFQGGGNMGNIYQIIESERENVFREFNHTNALQIQLPSSVNFNAIDEKDEDLNLIYDKVHVFTREAASYAEANKLSLGMRYLVPDIVFSLANTMPGLFSNVFKEKDSKIKRILVIRRQDEERVISEGFDQLVSSLRVNSDFDVTFTDTVIEVPNLSVRTDEFRKKLLSAKLSEIEKADIVITDRLHGMILALLSKIPVVAFDNSTHKIRSTCRQWLKDYPDLYFLESNQSVNVDDLRKWYSSSNQSRPNLYSDFEQLTNLLKDRN